MKTNKEIKPPFYEYTVPEYAKLMGLSEQQVRQRCMKGLLDAYRTSEVEGSHWKIKVRPDESMSKEEAEALRKENADLKARLNGIMRLAAV